MKVAAVIPAGGRGSRLGGDTPKQYIRIGGKPVLARTLAKFNLEGIDEIIVAAPSGDVEFVREEIVGRFGISGPVRVVAGGRERQDSVRAGLAEVGVESEIILVHDAVRPFISAALIKKVIDEASVSGAAALGVPVKDTVKITDEKGVVTGTIDRNNLWLTQTPQAFRRDIILEAYKQAYEDGFYATDEAALVERIGVPVKIVFGSYGNLKITTAEDLEMAEFMLTREEAG